MSSVTGARIGILGIILLALYSIGIVSMIAFLSRHEYDPSTEGIFGVIAISLLSAGIGSSFGHDILGVVITSAFCGLSCILTSGFFLGFRLPHQLILAVSSPIILYGSALCGGFVEQVIINKILN